MCMYDFARAQAPHWGPIFHCCYCINTSIVKRLFEITRGDLGVCQILRRGGGVYYPPCLLLPPTDLVIVDFDLVEDSVLDEAVEHRAVDLAEELPGVQFIL